MSFEAIPIDELLPQQPPFLLADRLLHYDDSETLTQLTLRADTPFVDAATGVMRAAGLVEVMAQCSAARIGYIHRYILHQPIRMGYVGAVAGLHVGREPRVGEVLTTRLRVVAELGGLTKAEATVTAGSETIASATLSVALEASS